MRMKLLALAALSALPAAALAQQTIVVPAGSVVQVTPVDPNAPVYYTSGSASAGSSSVPAGAPMVGNPVTGNYAGAPVVVVPGTPVTQKPAESGPGAIDRTHPGMEPGNAPSVRDAGTSSAGSN